MDLPVIAVDLVAMLIIAYALYYPRHRRKDLVVAFLVVNVGVLGVSTVLAQSTVGAGLGLGLFGVLSIIRLRSEEISHSEIAYYFASLAIGLIAGLSTTITATMLIMTTLIVMALAVCDHPKICARSRRVTVRLDHAVGTDAEATIACERILGIAPEHVTILDIDTVNDTAHVVARYRPQVTSPVTVGGVS